MSGFNFSKRSPLESYRLKDILLYHGRYIYYHAELTDENQLLVPPQQDIPGFALDNSLTEYQYRNNGVFHLETFLYVYTPELGWSDKPVAFSTLRTLNGQLMMSKRNFFTKLINQLKLLWSS